MPRASQKNESLRQFSAALRQDGSRPLKPSELSQTELFWRDHQPWLKEHGYELRPRYHPDWKPSWPNLDASLVNAEDALRPKRVHLLDAIRTADNRPVMLKRILLSEHPSETEIGQYFSSEPLSSEPGNHCAPLFEALNDPQNPDVMVLVTPYLRPYNDPGFETIGEAVNFFEQVFEGLQFMHKNHVAHRDCTGVNIMYDPVDLYPNGFHPVRIDRTVDLRGEAEHLGRTQKPCKYYFIDFGLSQRFDPADGEPSVAVAKGADSSAPEHEDRSVPHNPFPTDVYYLGNMIFTDFIKSKVGFDFMGKLVTSMIQRNPSARPTMDQVVEQFRLIQAQLTSRVLTARVASRNEFVVARYGRDIIYRGNQVYQYLKTRLPVFSR